MSVSMDDYRKRWLTLPEAAALLPRRRRGKKVSPSTLWRWARHGLQGVYLQVWQVGGGMCTNLESIDRFCEELSEKRGLRKHQDPASSDNAVDAKLASKGLI